MDALSKAPITEHVSGSGLAPISIPRAEHSTSGVSVEYVYDPAKSWFVFRASYGREDKVADLLITAGHYVYVAKRYEWRLENGRRRKELKNLIPNILFIYIGKDEAESILSRNEEKPSPIPELASITSFYYNHFIIVGGKNPPLEIPTYQMLNFIDITKSKDENVIYAQSGNIVHVKNNDYVRVRCGKFEGCMGLVVRVAGQQRVGLQLADLGWVATSYVPTAFLEVVSKEIYETHLNALKESE